MVKEPRKVKVSELNRRQMLALMGTGTSAFVAGCMGGGDGGDGGGDGGDGGGGGGGGGDGGSSDFADAMSDLDFSENWEERRGFANKDEWPAEERLDVPEGDALYEKQAWKDSGSMQNAHWEPPSGWEDTPAGDVDTLQHLNYGDLQFDRATVATYSLFEEATGITIEPLEIVVDQAIPRMAATFSSGEGKPQMLCNSAHQSMTSYASNGHLEPVPQTMPDDAMWEKYIPVANQTFHFDGQLWGGPNIVEGTMTHIRPKVIADQGVGDDVVQAMIDGSWDWSDLEAIMQAFEGTDQYAWAVRGSSRVYSEQDFKVMWYQTGGGYVNDDGSVTVNDDDAVYALEKLVEWQSNGWMPEAITNWTQGDLADGFLSENLLCVPVATDLIADSLDQWPYEPDVTADNEYAVTLFPKADQGSSPESTCLATTTLNSINAYAETADKVAASLYLDARYSYASSWWEYVEEGNMAYASDVYGDAAEQAPDSAFFSERKGEAMQTAKLDVYGQQRAISQRVSEEVQITLSGDKEPQQALDDAQDFIDTVLGQ